jgi:ubiquinone/menaquinone biosynthesis C-methylase UbiE
MEIVKQKEKDYHNKAFSEGTRKKLDKYYLSAKRSSAFYQHCLSSHCKGKSVLEYGCGPGSQAFLLAKHAAKVIGIDISEVAIEQATKQAKNEELTNLSFFVVDAESLDFANGSFDLICGSAILHHLNLNKAFAEIVRTLRPDGIAVFFEALGHNPMINLYRKLTPRLRTEDEHPLLMRDLKTAGLYFGKVETHYFHLFSIAAVPFHRLAVFRILLNILDGFDRLVFKLLPFTKKYAWITVMVLSQPKK